MLDAGDAAQAAIDGRRAGSRVDSGIAKAVGAQTGVDVQDARVHSDPLSEHSTSAMAARAFAYGNDIFLGLGERETDTALMAHELTHVAQQRGRGVSLQKKVDVGEDGSAAEAHADSVAARVVKGAPPPTLIVDAGPLAPGQALKQHSLDALKPQVVAVANAELGLIGTAAACRNDYDIVKLIDEPVPNYQESMKKARRHKLRTTFFGEKGPDEATFWIKDPKAGAYKPGHYDLHDAQGDVPGEAPLTKHQLGQDHQWQIRFDADGDQYKGDLDPESRRRPR